MTRAVSESSLFSQGVKHAYCNALRGEWDYVPHTVEQIDTQEYLHWNRKLGLTNAVSAANLAGGNLKLPPASSSSSHGQHGHGHGHGHGHVEGSSSHGHHHGSAKNLSRTPQRGHLHDMSRTPQKGSLLLPSPGGQSLGDAFDPTISKQSTPLLRKTAVSTQQSHSSPHKHGTRLSRISSSRHSQNLVQDETTPTSSQMTTSMSQSMLISQSLQSQSVKKMKSSVTLLPPHMEAGGTSSTTHGSLVLGGSKSLALGSKSLVQLGSNNLGTAGSPSESQLIKKQPSKSVSIKDVVNTFKSSSSNNRASSSSAQASGQAHQHGESSSISLPSLAQVGPPGGSSHHDQRSSIATIQSSSGPSGASPSGKGDSPGGGRRSPSKSQVVGDRRKTSKKQHVIELEPPEEPEDDDDGIILSYYDFLFSLFLV